MREKPRGSSDNSPAPSIEAMGKLLAACGVALSGRQLQLLWTYHQLLREYNPELNLTRIHSFENMVLKLYVDSILPARFVDLPSPLLDLGTGPGMPGIPLKIAYPDLEVILAESRGKRVEFLNLAVERLGMKGLSVVGQGVTPAFQEPVSGVITRAVETIGGTLDRIRGCLNSEGLAVFMKGPNCDEEIRDAQSPRFSDDYLLIKDQTYHIPSTPHERRLVVFRRSGKPLWAVKADIMKRHVTKVIESEQNDQYKDMKKLLTSHGIRKLGLALVFGSKQVIETIRDFPERCEAWITDGDDPPPPPDAPPGMAWRQLAHPLFTALDAFGTRAPILCIRIPQMDLWEPESGLPKGCSVLAPFQDPENVGALIRSAAAFGVDQVILLAESAHPYHPKALRASGGATLKVRLMRGPALATLPQNLTLLPLSPEGRNISEILFPDTFGLLPGVEGPGLPEAWRKRAVAIPMAAGVESLNAATAAAIALYAWNRSKAARE